MEGKVVMGSVVNGIPTDLVMIIKNIVPCTFFVETGTFMGDTSEWAAGNFDRVITIESSRELFNQSSKRLSTLKNVQLINGNSASSIASFISQLPASMFWLDAHYSGGVTSGKYHECPLLSELSVIMPWMDQHVVLIDDARMFLQPPPKPHNVLDWPSIDEIFRIVSGFRQTYSFVYKDVLVILPVRYRREIAKILQTP